MPTKDFHQLRAYQREFKKTHGVDCPECKKRFPNRTPSKLVPGATCQMDGYTDPRAPIEDRGAPMNTNGKRQAVEG